MEEFIKYVKDERNSFVNVIRKQDWNNELRTAAESLLIAYDQMTAKLEVCDGKSDSTSGKDLTGVQSYGVVLGCHIGHNVTVIEQLVRAVENQTGETVICVNMHKDEMDFFNRPIKEKEPFIIQAIDRSCCQMLPIEKPSHKRPYKFHR